MGEGGGRLEGQWLEALMRLELGSGLRRGEWRGKKKGQAASGDKGDKAWGPGAGEGSGGAAGGGGGGFQPRLAAERVTDCVARHSGDPLSPSRGTERETQKDGLTRTVWRQTRRQKKIHEELRPPGHARRPRHGSCSGSPPPPPRPLAPATQDPGRGPVSHRG